MGIGIGWCRGRERKHRLCFKTITPHHLQHSLPAPETHQPKSHLPHTPLLVAVGKKTNE
jgi:hypothetical protein